MLGQPSIRMMASPVSWYFLASFAILSTAQACSQPQGWKSKKGEEVLCMADLVILAKFKSNSTTNVPNQDRVSGYDYHKKLDTEVLCVVSENQGANVPKRISITEVRPGSLDNFENPCIDYYHTIKYDEPVFVMIKPREDIEGEFGFETENLQGPYYYEDDVSLDKMCATALEAPSGGSGNQCPSGLQKRVGSNAWRVQSWILLTFLSLFVYVQVIWG